MITSRWFTRARVRRHAPADALRALLLPDDAGRRAGAGHRIVWTLFADAPDRGRDFLWRETDAGTFFILSRREPVDRHGLFELDPPKAFAPQLAPGDRLAFSVRANATIAKKGDGEARGKPVDVVMAAIREVPSGERARARAEAVGREGCRWLVRQGDRCGFVLEAEATRVTTYRTLRVDHRGPDARIGVLDMDGILEVREPDRFIDAIGAGFGRAKAFGCGLMMIRRAP